MESVLKQHADRYPLMEPTDAVKLVYQNEFGGGHLIADEAACLAYLRAEYEKTPAAPYYAEDLGNGICRVYLGGVTDIEALGRAFLQSAAMHKGSLPAFLEKLETLRKVTRESVFVFTSEDLESYLAEYQKAGYPPVSHSETYRRAYHPAYRVILKSKEEQMHGTDL